LTNKAAASVYTKVFRGACAYGFSSFGQEKQRNKKTII
jgi:hypothetical protein